MVIATLLNTCVMSCMLCSGTMGLRGDLSSGEILEQLLHAMAIAPIRNIVFMGQGEVRVVKLYM